MRRILSEKKASNKIKEMLSVIAMTQLDLSLNSPVNIKVIFLSIFNVK